MNEEFMQQILEENKDAVKEKVKQAMLESVQRQFEWELPKALQESVSEFIATEIVPEIKKDLLENKQVFVDAATSFVQGVPIEIGKALQELVAEKLTNSYNIRKLVEALT